MADRSPRGTGKRGPQSPKTTSSSAAKSSDRGSATYVRSKSKQPRKGDGKSGEGQGGSSVERQRSQDSVQSQQDSATASKRTLFSSSPSKSSNEGGEVKSKEQGAAKEATKKPTSKAERRALQEAQRKAKAERQIVASKAGQAASKTAQAASKTAQASSKTGLTASRPGQTTSKEERGSGGGGGGGGGDGAGGGEDQKLSQHRSTHSSRSAAKIQTSSDLQQVQHFAHLPLHERKTRVLNLLKDYQPPPCILQLGIQYSEENIYGSNARCIALLAAFKKVIQEYSTPPQKELRRDLDSVIKPYINFLAQCRPLSVSMGNAIKHLKLKISQVPPDTTETEAKVSLCEMIDGYIREKIELADKAISEFCGKVIENGDVILVHAYSSVVQSCLIDAHRSGKKFKVVVVSSRPKLEGHECLRELVAEGIKCSYIFISAVSYIMKEVSKVIVGAHALLANGYVMSRIGTSLIALVAKSYNVPVLVCCETYKFSDRVQTDAFVTNELGDPNDLVPINRRQGNFLANWKSIEKLQLLNLVYDVTSPDLITMVITQLGNIPCSSVPVVLRISRTFEQM